MPDLQSPNPLIMCIYLDATKKKEGFFEDGELYTSFLNMALPLIFPNKKTLVISLFVK